jgi:hypothetical protein
MRKHLLLTIMILTAALALGQAGMQKARNRGRGNSHMSFVTMSNPKGKVGDHFSARITYQIGWFNSNPGTVVITDDEISSPEYAIFGDVPPGLQLDQSGYLTGTPTQAGSYIVFPAVRDRNRLLYDGHGFWMDQGVIENGTGKVFREPKDPGITIVIER